MRYKRKVTDEQIKFIIDNPTISNLDLAKKFGVEPTDIGNYRSRLRKMGVDIPKNKRPVIGLKKIALSIKKK
jgi:hypothetical protein